MLVLSRRLGESITIADAVTVTVLRLEGGKVRLGIEAPPQVRILRQEVQDRATKSTPLTIEVGVSQAERSAARN